MFGRYGTLNNMDPSDWVGSLHGGALDFDGSNDYVRVSDNTRFDWGSEQTVSAWVFISSTPGNPDTILKKGFATVIEPQWIFVDSNTLRVRLDTTGSNTLDTITNLQTNRWYFLASVYDGSTLKWFVDGVEDNSSSVSGAINTTNNDFYIGSGNAGTDGQHAPERYFNGQIEDVHIYTRATSADEVRQLLTDPYANILSSPIRRYFDQAVENVFEAAWGDQSLDPLIASRFIDVVGY